MTIVQDRPTAIPDDLPRPSRFDQASWTRDAACTGMDPELFFPRRGEPTAEARAVCGRCPVREPCLEYALRNVEKFGIWGGLSERERRKRRGEMRSQRRVPCEVCGVEVVAGIAMTNHARLTHAPRLVACPECGQDVEEGALADHARERHGTLPCPICDQVFPRGLGMLRQHLQDVHAPKSKPTPAAAVVGHALPLQPPQPRPAWRKPPPKVEQPELPMSGLPPPPKPMQPCEVCGQWFKNVAAHARRHQRLAS